MNKDVIYIDVEDDITAIIGKIKACKENIVALVPPKHVGILQSAVNLRLLDRMASTSHKRLVLITNNQALIALSSVAGIPVAKNLQSKPEMAEVSALSLDDADDIIDGSQLSVGELAKTADVVSDKNEPSEKEISAIKIDDKSMSVAALGDAIKKPVKSKSGVKVPNFNTFRKKLFIGISLGVLLTAFLVWAIGFAPAATVVITARTIPEPVSTTVTLGGTTASDVTNGTIQSETQQIKKDVSISFDATGQKDLGVKATGTMKITRTSVSSSPLTVPTGTTFTDGTYVFVSTQAATLQGTQVGTNGFIQDSATVAVEAENPGEAYNLSARSYQSDFSGISADGSAMTGGTSRIATVVTADDIQKATTQLSQQSTDSIKQQLIKQFTNGETVIGDSFTVNMATPVSVPAVDAEAANGKAQLTASVTYSIIGIAKSDLELFLKASLNKQLSGTQNQRLYDDGISNVKLSDYTTNNGVSTVKITSTGQIGPQIDASQIKEQVKGKIFGDVQASLSAIPGVNNVDVHFSYFWVSTVPTDVNKISVEFKLQNG